MAYLHQKNPATDASRHVFSLFILRCISYLFLYLHLAFFILNGTNLTVFGTFQQINGTNAYFRG